MVNNHPLVQLEVWGMQFEDTGIFGIERQINPFFFLVQMVIWRAYDTTAVIMGGVWTIITQIWQWWENVPFE